MSWNVSTLLGGRLELGAHDYRKPSLVDVFASVWKCSSHRCSLINAVVESLDAPIGDSTARCGDAHRENAPASRRAGPGWLAAAGRQVGGPWHGKTASLAWRPCSGPGWRKAEATGRGKITEGWACRGEEALVGFVSSQGGRHDESQLPEVGRVNLQISYRTAGCSCEDSQAVAGRGQPRGALLAGSSCTASHSARCCTRAVARATDRGIEGSRDAGGGGGKLGRQDKEEKCGGRRPSGVIAWWVFGTVEAALLVAGRWRLWLQPGAQGADVPGGCWSGGDQQRHCGRPRKSIKGPKALAS